MLNTQRARLGTLTVQTARKRTEQHAFTFALPKPHGKEFRVVSMFSGCGGMDLGFLGGFRVFGRTYDRLPFRIIWANELNPAACRTYRRNIGPHISCDDVWDALGYMPTRADVLIGGFPCQDISVNGKGAGVSGKRSGLYRAMIEGIKRVQPTVFVAENVKGLLMKAHEQSLRQVLNDLVHSATR